ncbi:MAG: GTPase Era [Baileyella intestinalis]|jgi:GTP-binding protein Era|uniref:GTPase Era n=1 Tax=Baileyella intestinalis TaxID=2606709 RepID=A0A6A8M4J3_9FIRM|nr:GTPase Era [Baileyella intestinalis]MCI7686489.1 GTPase Era [Clostridiales bacterium]MDY2995400.1 GTPase Era [Baileyella intestinalis]MST68225.1 GTPase Era [Baileyella intestinalis]
MKSGFIGIAGRPNVGKSTFLNRILGEKIAITSAKPQTTRNRITGIYTDLEADGGEGLQMVFLDTPGIHKSRNKLGDAINETAVNTFKGVDVILLIADGSREFSNGDKYILDMLKETDVPRILAINKMDLMKPEEYLNLYNKYMETGLFQDVYGVSALKGTGVKELLECLKGFMPEGPMFFPEDMVTNDPERFLVSEIIREKLLTYLDDEVPHGVFVEIESFKEEKDITDISAVIYCEKKSHKSIIIGKGGRKLKGVGKSARLEIQDLLGTKVYLQLWVKVRENWRDSDRMIRSLGYKDE